MTLNKKMLPAAMLALALMGLHAGSRAGTLTTHHGSKCKPEGWSSDAQAFKAVNGIWNYTNAPMSVVCPVTRMGPPTSGGLRVWIDGYLPSGSQAGCTFFSIEYNGTELSGAGSRMTGTGLNFNTHIDLYAGYVSMYSSEVLTCDLPPGAGFYDVELENLP